MYQVDIDVAADPSAVEAVQSLRRELNPLGIHVRVLDLHGPGGGNPDVRLTCQSRARLTAWLAANDYDSDAHQVIDPQHPNRVPRT